MKPNIKKTFNLDKLTNTLTICDKAFTETGKKRHISQTHKYLCCCRDFYNNMTLALSSEEVQRST